MNLLFDTNLDSNLGLCIARLSDTICISIRFIGYDMCFYTVHPIRHVFLYGTSDTICVYIRYIRYDMSFNTVHPIRYVFLYGTSDTIRVSIRYIRDDMYFYTVHPIRKPLQRRQRLTSNIKQIKSWTVIRI